MGSGIVQRGTDFGLETQRPPKKALLLNEDNPKCVCVCVRLGKPQADSIATDFQRMLG